MSEPSPNIPPSLNQLAAVSWRILVVAALTLAVLYILTRLQFVMLALFLALLIVAVLSPLRTILERRGFPHVAAVWTVLLLTILGFVALLAAVVIPFILDFGNLVDSVNEGVNQLITWLEDGPLHIPQDINILERARSMVTENAQTLASGVIGTTMKGIEILASLLLAVPIIFFFLKDSAQINRWLLGWVSLRHRDRVQDVASQGWNTVGDFVRGTALVATFDAVFIGAGLLILGIPLAGSLIVLTFISAFIPVIGAFTAGIAAVLVALVTQGFTDALIVLGIVIVVQQLEGNLIAPLLVGHQVRLHPVAILLAISIGGTLGGIMGAFVAVPVTAYVYAIAAAIREPDLADFGP